MGWLLEAEMDAKRIFKMRDVCMPLSKRKLMTQERERRVTKQCSRVSKRGLDLVHKWRGCIYLGLLIVLPN